MCIRRSRGASAIPFGMAKKNADGRKRGAGVGSRVRDALTGRFLPKGTENRRPKTAVVERLTRRFKRK